MPGLQVEYEHCEFCDEPTGNVDLELYNITGAELLTCKVCMPCAVLASGAHVRYDSEGLPYSNLGCIGGAPEETN